MTNSPTCTEVVAEFAGFLRRALPHVRLTLIRDHLDACDTCWRDWNRYRWDAASGHPLMAELRQFLGPRFRPYFDSSRALQAEWLAAAPSTAEHRQAFFGSTESYLYNLAIWHASGNRPRYVTAGAAYLPASCRILDFGAGIGQDAIELTRLGHQVIACEIPGPCTDFLRWRLKEHDLHIEIRPPQQTSNVAADTLWIIDTIDHLLDIDTALCGILLTVDRVFCENLHVTRRGGQDFHERRSFKTIADALRRYQLFPIPVSSASPLTGFARHESM